MIMPPPTYARAKKAQEQSTSPVTLLCSYLLTAAFFVIAILFLAFPNTSRNLLFPCLSKTSQDAPPEVLEGDTIRLAGACFMSLAMSCMGLMVPLLPCFQDKSSESGDVSSYFLLRSIMFMQASMGMCLVGIGLLNLRTTGDVYDNSYHCSSLEDQTILWMGTATVCLTSLGLMASFWPKSIESNNDNMHNAGNPGRTRCCCSKKMRLVRPDSLERMEEPLLVDEVGEEGGQSTSNGSPASNNSTTNTEERNEGETSAESTSRLRGTSRLLKLAGSESLYLWVGVAVLLVRLPFSLSIPHFVSTTIARLIDADFDGAKLEVLLLFLLGTVDSVLDFWCIFLFGMAKENIVRTVRVDTFSSMMRQEQAFFDKTNTGALLSRLTSDCGEIGHDLTWFFRFSIEALVRISGISVYMLVRSPTLGLCALAIVPFVGILNKIYGDWLSKNAQGVQTALADASSCAAESLACIKTVITLSSEDYEREKYEKQIEKHYGLNIHQLIMQGVYFGSVSTFLINTCVQASLLLLGSIFVEKGKLTPEILIAFMLYQGQLQEYTMNLFESYSSLIKSSGAGDRIFYLLDRQPPPPGTGNTLVKAMCTLESEGRTYEDVSIENVSFSYPTRPDIKALDQLSLKIKSGTTVALVGHSGCGKSTIVALLERLYDPNEGEIKFGNVDLKNMSIRAHREKIGLVTQDPVLFSGTIAENIGYGSSATFEEIVEAARIANAHTFIESFPKKYEEQVGERGQSLSGGQKQRIAIARALVRAPAMLLLDEATSALDPESELAVQEALNELLINRFGMTTIIIAHRLQTVRSADTIFVLENGSVVEQGSHNDLVQHERGHYRRMIDRMDSTGHLPE